MDTDGLSKLSHGDSSAVLVVLPLRRAGGRGGGARVAGDADGAAVDGVAAGRVVPAILAPAHGRAAPGHLRRSGEESNQNAF